MPIRWVNHEVKPLPRAAGWIVVMTRYPALILALGAIPATAAVLLSLGYGDLSVFAALRDVPRALLLAALVLVAASCGYGFWVYALSRPGKTSPRE